MGYAIDGATLPGIVRVHAYGDGSQEEGKQLIEALRDLASARGRLAVLLDARELDYVPSSSEARTLGELFGRLGRDHHCRIAYLARPGVQYGVVRMLDIIGSLHGGHAAGFTDEAEAISWLGVSPADAP